MKIKRVIRNLWWLSTGIAIGVKAGYELGVKHMTKKTEPFIPKDKEYQVFNTKEEAETTLAKLVELYESNNEQQIEEYHELLDDVCGYKHSRRITADVHKSQILEIANGYIIDVPDSVVVEHI